jgi:hypothetical protein
VSRRTGAGAPAGSVVFSVDGQRVSDAIRLDAYGAATWRTALQSGEHRVSATYTPADGTLLPSTSVDLVSVVRGEAVTISDLSLQAGNENTACPALGVAYTRADADGVPLLRYALPSLDKQCASRGAGLSAASITFLRCAKDPRGTGFGPNASVNLTCGR